jgi:NAD(P)H-hydrate epimerase
VTVLKDCQTVISTENGEIYLSNLGNEGLAKGGSGDTLAGLIAGFAAQDYTLADAAIIGTAVHGLSAALCAKENGKMAMLPSDLEKYTVKLLASLGF